MRAIQIAEPGGAEKLVLREVPMPAPGVDDLLIEVVASGVNFIDIYVREGRYGTSFPAIPGQEAAGIVVQVGNGVDGFAVGDRVAWCSVLGTYAEYAVAPAQRVVKVPDGVSLTTAAAVLLQGMTAHYLTKSLYVVGPDDHVLVHAGAGGVGLLLTQMAREQGANVISSVSTEEKAVLSQEAGANGVVLYGRGHEDPYTSLYGTMHVVYDSVGLTTFEESLKCLRDRGTLALYGTASGPVPPFDLERLARGSYFVTRPILRHYTATSEELRWRASELFQAVLNDGLRVVIGRAYPLELAGLAHADMQSKNSFGKLILQVRPE